MDEQRAAPDAKTLMTVMTESRLESDRRAIPTSFDSIDRLLGGGIKTGDLTVVGGLPGVGKTVAALQWARSAALAGETTVFACYEHDERTLYLRLLLAELAESGSPRMEEEREARRILRQVGAGTLSIDEALSSSPAIIEAHDRVGRFADRLLLVRASGVYTTIDSLASMLDVHGASVLVVDYLQKVPLDYDIASEIERITIVSQGLKELALGHSVAVVAIAAADRAGLDAPRLRLRHLRGSSAMAYEADVAIILNEKFNIVSRGHIAHDLTSAERFKTSVVFSVEKNREGTSMTDVEFAKDFEHYRFDPAGRLVNERLIDERVILE